MAKAFVEKTCSKCGKTFRTANNNGKCYNCTLDEITGGYAPEEGDYNSARIISGEITEAEFRELQQELGAVELGS